MKKFFGKCLLKITGWKIDTNLPEEVHQKCVIIAAPHTSNWDYPLTLSCMSCLGVNLRYTIKKSWMKPPVGWFFRAMGGISVNRTAKKEGEERLSVVDAIAGLFDKHDKLCVIVQGEGTRSLRKQWKTGFYYIALKANVPLVLGYLNYEKKIGGIGKVIYPSGDVEKDLAEVMEFYSTIPAKNPENFSVDVRFYPAKKVTEVSPDREDKHTNESDQNLD